MLKVTWALVIVFLVSSVYTDVSERPSVGAPWLVSAADEDEEEAAYTCLSNISITFSSFLTNDATTLGTSLCTVLGSSQCIGVTFVSTTTSVVTEGTKRKTLTSLEYLVNAVNRSTALASVLNSVYYASLLSPFEIYSVEVPGIVTLFTAESTPSLTYKGSTAQCIPHFWYLMFFIIFIPILIMGFHYYYYRGRKEERRNMQLLAEQNRFQSQSEQRQAAAAANPAQYVYDQHGNVVANPALYAYDTQGAAAANSVQYVYDQGGVQYVYDQPAAAADTSVQYVYDQGGVQYVYDQQLAGQTAATAQQMYVTPTASGAGYTPSPLFSPQAAPQ